MQGLTKLRTFEKDTLNCGELAINPSAQLVRSVNSPGWGMPVLAVLFGHTRCSGGDGK
jgi:hypothetical protein